MNGINISAAQLLPVFVAAFAVGLIAIAIFLFSEWLRVHLRQRKRVRILHRFVDSSGGSDEEEAPETSILRKRHAESWLDAVTDRMPHMRDVQTVLDQAALSWSPGWFFTQCVIYGILVAVIAGSVGKGWIAGAGGFLVGVWIPWLQAKRRRKKRLAAFEENFPEAIDLLTRALRAGSPFSAGLKMIADDMPEPISSEFRRVFEEQKHGLPLPESFEGLVARIELLDVRIFVTAVLVQREVGGNLAEILEKISKTIRERFSIKRQVQVYTAQGRLTGYVLSGLPLGVAGALYAMNPEYMGLLFTHPIGKMMCGVALFMQLLGFFIIQKIVDIDV